MTGRVHLGETFENLHPGSPRHLWLVVSTPDDDGSSVIFNFTTPKSGCDRTCVVVPGEHPFVTHETVVAYWRGRLLDREAYDSLSEMGCRKPWVDLSPVLLKRVQEGALASPFAPQKLQAIVRQELGL